MVRMGEINIRIKFRRDSFMLRKLFPVVERHVVRVAASVKHPVNSNSENNRSVRWIKRRQLLIGQRSDSGESVCNLTFTFSERADSLWQLFVQMQR